MPLSNRLQMPEEHADDRSNGDALPLDEGGLVYQLAAQHAFQRPQQAALIAFDIAIDGITPIAHAMLFEVEEHRAGKGGGLAFERAQYGVAVEMEGERRVRGAEIQAAILCGHLTSCISGIGMAALP